jgi:nucleotide-binding universal stress UspA family protein
MSERYQRILVALDASARARGVLAAAVDLARRFEAKLVLFRAVGMPPARELEAMDEAPEKVPEILEHHAEHDLEELARNVPPELLGKVSVHLGTPWQAICRAAQQEGAQLIVLGSHGYGGLDRILGTTAAKVVNHADRSVLVVRDLPAMPADAAG